MMLGMKAMWFKLVALLLVGMAQMMAQETQLEVKSESSVNSYEVGKPFYVALQGKAPESWHAYYRNPATVGQPMSATLLAPAGFSVEGPFWQVPELHKSGVTVAYVYNKPVVVWRVTPQPGAPAKAHFVLSARAQLCNDLGCMPDKTVSTELDLEQGTAEPNPEWSRAESQVESLGDTALQEVHAQRMPGGVTLRFQAPAEVKTAYFFSDDNSVDPSAEQVLTVKDGVCELTLLSNDGKNSLFPAPEAQPGAKKRLVGMLSLGEAGHARVDVPVESAGAGMPAGLWEAMVGLFLGGLLLNLMPCVFPVLGLKIMSFVSLGGGSRRRVVGHSLAFVVGILVSFWILGVLLVAASNADVLAQAPVGDWLGILWGDDGAANRSWAAWMENQWVVYGILLLLIVLGLWMFGIFELGARATGLGAGLQSKGGYAGSFFQGLFVTVVATPCSAPYLGAAMPTAMSFPAVWMLVALTAMALGFSLPYLVLGIFPGLVRFLPKPGAWMESLKQGLSFCLFAAAAWMLDVYLSFVTASGRADETMWVLIALVIFISAFWVFGRWCPLYRSRTSRVVGGIVALALLVGGVWYSMPQAVREDAPEWEAWTPEAMEEALDDGIPVYVDFTAKWCATCQSNKKFAYTDEVYKIFKANDVKLFRADKTHPNEKIDAELRRLKRSAVPTNALYLPDKEPIVTRELLTPAYLLEFLKEHL